MTRHAIADVLVVGAGFVGLSVAFALRTKASTSQIVVVDAADFAAGGSGRNGAGFRMQWSRDFNIQLSKDSLETFEHAAELLDYPGGIDLRQDGYLILAHSEEAMAELREAVQVQVRLGVPSELLDVDDCLKIQPGLNADGLYGASYCDKDGTASPFKWLDALLKANRSRGTQVDYGCKVLSLQSDGENFLARTNQGSIVAHKVAVCTDWETSELLDPLGIHLPVKCAAKQAMITEPQPPLLRTVLMASRVGLGVKQLARGNIILTLTEAEASAPDQGQTPGFSGACASAAVRLLPSLSDVKMLRQWSGTISETPDMQPVLGETRLPGLFVAVSAYKGFMMSPQMGRIMADLIVFGRSDHVAAAALSPARFAAGELVPETLTI